jgi:hypothetical protein
MQYLVYVLPRISLLPRTSVNRGWEEKPGLINTAAEQAGVSAEQVASGKSSGKTAEEGASGKPSEKPSGKIAEEAASGKPSGMAAEEAARSATEGASGTQEVSRKAPQEVPH